jgi:hypothetical protein
MFILEMPYEARCCDSTSESTSFFLKMCIFPEAAGTRQPCRLRVRHPDAHRPGGEHTGAKKCLIFFSENITFLSLFFGHANATVVPFLQ